MGRTKLSERFSRFKREEPEVGDWERTVRPSTDCRGKNVENIRKIIKERRRSTISEIAGTLCLSYGICQRI
jgi:hypothetical protein